MTPLSPTALEAAARSVERCLTNKDVMGYINAPNTIATAAITAYLAQAGKEGWVLVPADTLAAIKSMLTIEAIAPAEHGFEREKRREAWGRIEAMLSAAQNGGK